MECRDERERFENLALGRECEAALVVAALQRCFLLDTIEETDNEQPLVEPPYTA